MCFYLLREGKKADSSEDEISLDPRTQFCGNTKTFFMSFMTARDREEK